MCRMAARHVPSQMGYCAIAVNEIGLGRVRMPGDRGLALIAVLFCFSFSSLWSESITESLCNMCLLMSLGFRRDFISRDAGSHAAEKHEAFCLLLREIIPESFASLFHVTLM